MISATRMLCQKYTDLTDAEISYLESYGALLPALANAEQADVFIDCRTVSGRSAIVVCEAKPQTVPSNYRSSILGMLIHWRDEPAVDRSFRLAVPTSGVRAVSMPEDRRIVQSVEPLFYEGRLIGVLIYERPALAAEEPPPAGEREAEQASGALDWAAVSPCLDDAVLFLDEEDRVCGFNPAATALYRRMGYIGTLAGMPVNNIQPAALSECDQDGHETALANRVLQYQRLPLSSGQARAALIIHDLTRQRQLEEAAFRLGGGGFLAPCQRVEDFLAHRPSTGPGAVLPSYRPGVTWCDLHGCLPSFLTGAMEEALPLLERKLRGYAQPDALLTAVETRSSSPVRILRDESGQSALRGLYPCGEGAGYAGGILSAAADGMRCAEKIWEVYS